MLHNGDCPEGLSQRLRLTPKMFIISGFGLGKNRNGYMQTQKDHIEPPVTSKPTTRRKDIYNLQIVVYSLDPTSRKLHGSMHYQVAGMYLSQPSALPSAGDDASETSCGRRSTSDSSSSNAVAGAAIWPIRASQEDQQTIWWDGTECDTIDPTQYRIHHALCTIR